MPLDPRGKETQEWLTIAKTDLAVSQSLAANEEFAAQTTFHAQQAAEKALKAFLVWHQERFKKDHDLRYLGNLAVKKDATLADPVNEAIRLAERVYSEILSRLPKEVHPQ